MQLAPSILPTAVASLAYSNGMRGVQQTINIMRRMVNDFKLSPIIRDAAVSVIFLTPAKACRSEVSALFDYVKSQVRYVQDIAGVETISTPERTLQSRAGDCDDMALLLAALCESVGYPSRFVVAGYVEPGTVEHVYCQIFCDGAWLDADPTESGALGDAPDGAVSVFIEAI